VPKTQFKRESFGKSVPPIASFELPVRLEPVMKQACVQPNRGAAVEDEEAAAAPLDRWEAGVFCSAARRSAWRKRLYGAERARWVRAGRDDDGTPPACHWAAPPVRPRHGRAGPLLARHFDAVCCQNTRSCSRGGPGTPGACCRVAAGRQRASAGAVVQLDTSFLSDLQFFGGATSKHYYEQRL